MFQWTNSQRYPCVYLKKFLYDIYLNVDLLCYRACETLLHIAKLLSRVFVPIYISISNVWEFLCSTSSPTLYIVRLSNYCQFDGWEMESNCSFYFYIPNNQWGCASFHILTAHLSSLFCDLFIPIICQFLSSCLTKVRTLVGVLLYILEKNLWLYTQLTVIFSCRNIFNFNVVKCFFIPFVFVSLKIVFLIPMSYFLLNVLFSSKCFIFLFWKFTSLVYLELIWGYGIKEQSSCIFPCRLLVAPSPFIE